VSEPSVTVRLPGEISRLELIEAGYDTSSSTGYSQTKIERFFSQYSNIPHPFGAVRQLELSPAALAASIRLLLHIVFSSRDGT
jgi:hypothetical protein